LTDETDRVFPVAYDWPLVSSPASNPVAEYMVNQSIFDVGIFTSFPFMLSIQPAGLVHVLFGVLV
jgi:hypothetical protein